MVAIGTSMTKADYERMQKNIETVAGLRDSDAILLLEHPAFPYNREKVLRELACMFKGTILPVRRVR